MNLRRAHIKRPLIKLTDGNETGYRRCKVCHRIFGQMERVDTVLTGNHLISYCMKCYDLEIKKYDLPVT